jgi:hypothetical protein
MRRCRSTDLMKGHGWRCDLKQGHKGPHKAARQGMQVEWYKWRKDLRRDSLVPKTEPHGPVSERFMVHHYGPSGFVPRDPKTGNYDFDCLKDQKRGEPQ